MFINFPFLTRPGVGLSLLVNDQQRAVVVVKSENVTDFATVNKSKETLIDVIRSNSFLELRK